MKYLALILILISSHAYGAASRFKGWEETQSVLKARLMAPGEPVDLSRYLPGMTPGPASIYELLGTYSATTGMRTFRNGEPNSVNTLLWYILLSSLSDDIAAGCHQSSQQKLHPKFEQRLAALCAWPAAAAKDEAVLQGYWLSLMRYDAPIEEYQAWREFFLSSSYQSKTANEAVSAMTLAIFLNPYFLLEK